MLDLDDLKPKAAKPEKVHKAKPAIARSVAKLNKKLKPKVFRENKEPVAEKLEESQPDFDKVDLGDNTRVRVHRPIRSTRKVTLASAEEFFSGVEIPEKGTDHYRRGMALEDMEPTTKAQRDKNREKVSLAVRKEAEERKRRKLEAAALIKAEREAAELAEQEEKEAEERALLKRKALKLVKPPTPILAKDIGEDSRSSRKKAARLEEESDLPADIVESTMPVVAIERDAYAAAKSVFGDKADSIVEMLDVGNNDGALSVTIKTLLHTLINILPKVESYVLRTDGQKGVYQLSQLVSQMRDVCADIQAYRDKTNLGSTLVERYVRPSFLDIGVQIMQAWILLDGAARDRMTPEAYQEYVNQTMLPVRKQLAAFISKKFDDTSTALMQSLN